MKKKQLLGILLAGTMMVGAAVPVFAADGDRVKITYAQWGNETETAATQAVADKFNSEQDKIEVEVVKIDHDTYVTKLNAMATAGELPDTGIMSEAGVLKFAENGLLADITKILTEKNISIRSLNTRVNKQGYATLAIAFEINSREQLNTLVDKLRSIESVMDIERTTG